MVRRRTPQLSIRHQTLYTYERPVRFAAQRLLVRPRESHAIRVVETSLALSLPRDTRWVYEALGNSVCRFTPRGEGRSLSIVSHLTIEQFPTPLARLQIADPRTATPIVYASADRTVLAPFIDPVSEDVEGPCSTGCAANWAVRRSRRWNS